MKRAEVPKQTPKEVVTDSIQIENSNVIQHNSEVNLNNEHVKSENSKDDEKKSCISNCRSTIFRLLDLDLLQDPVFISILVGLAIIQLTTSGFTMIFPIFMQDGLNMTTGQTAQLLSVAAGCDLVGNYTHKILGKRGHISQALQFITRGGTEQT